MGQPVYSWLRGRSWGLCPNQNSTKGKHGRGQIKSHLHREAGSRDAWRATVETEVHAEDSDPGPSHHQVGLNMGRMVGGGLLSPVVVAPPSSIAQEAPQTPQNIWNSVLTPDPLWSAQTAQGQNAALLSGKKGLQTRLQSLRGRTFLQHSPPGLPREGHFQVLTASWAEGFKGLDQTGFLPTPRPSEHGGRVHLQLDPAGLFGLLNANK